MMFRRLIIHLLARFKRRKPAGYELPDVPSPFAERERWFVASHRMAGARVDYTEQSIAYLEQAAHKLLQWRPSEEDGADEAALTEDEWKDKADEFVTMCGSYLGSVIIMQLGGQWRGDPIARDEMSVENIGATAVCAHPFKVISERLFRDSGNLWRWYRSLKTDVQRKQNRAA